MNVPDMRIWNEDQEVEEDVFELTIHFFITFDGISISVTSTKLSDVAIHDPDAVLNSLRDHKNSKHFIICMNCSLLVCCFARRRVVCL